MHRRVVNRVKFLIERLTLRGAQYRLLMIAALIGLISVIGGGVVYYFRAGVEGGLGDAIWWAFLRLTDPGYLGDDTGSLRRFVSTILTVLGYVVFLGALVAIMTQWLNERMQALEAGLTPITQSDHVLLLGWTNRTPTIVRELVLSQTRLRNFLRRHGARRLRIAILADTVTSSLRVELRDRLGARWNERQVILRTGSPLRNEHLRRVDFVHAAAVILPAADFAQGGPQHADTRAIKTLLSMTNHPLANDADELPIAVVEIFDSRKLQVALNAYGGPIEILASDAIISRLIAQNVRHRGLSHVYGEVLTHGRGNEIYIREAGNLAGMAFGALGQHFPHAVVIGIVQPDGDSFRSRLNPAADLTIERDARIAVLARSYEASAPVIRAAPQQPIMRRETIPATTAERAQRVLVLGWNHKAPALLREFDSYSDERFTIDLVSIVPIDVRRAALGRYDFSPRNIAIEQIEGDYATSALLRRLEPATYDDIVLLGSDALGSGEESDARSIVGYLLLRELLPKRGGPNVIVELLDEANLSLFGRRTGEVIVSPRILSHMLAQVALRRELRAVFDELFGPSGAEIVFRAPADYGLAGMDVSFRDVEERTRAWGEIALGVRSASTVAERGRGVALNPARDRRWALAADDQIIALTYVEPG